MRAFLAPTLAAVLAAGGISSLFSATAPAGMEAPPQPMIEIAILLDTSGSMDGLIGQARTRLWSIVNDLAKTSKDGVIPDVRVALYEYGNSSLTADGQWIRQVQPLTDDLDAISEGLFALRTNGGEEYCGAVISRAVGSLAWSEGDHFRAIFIAGNEPFTQGPVSWESACKAAVAKGIVVNTLLCGETDQTWVAAARLADGEALTINQNAVEVAIAAPQDQRLLELNAELNKTYLAFGAEGEVAAQRQEAQDANAAASAPSSFAGRVASKSSVLYANSSWDLVDAVKEKKVDLATLDEDALPELLRDKTPEERKQVIEAHTKRRAELQSEIATVAKDREAFIEAERAKQGVDQADGFDAAVRAALARELTAKGYTSP